MSDRFKRYTIHTVDVFTDTPLTGNQLAVVLDAEGIPGDVMQRIAKEMNISETTFVLKPESPGSVARVRIFTPTSELPFAGHPTIGTAWVLFTEGRVPGGSVDFTLDEGVGPVALHAERGANSLTFWMTHPKVSFGDILPDRAGAASALGLADADLAPDVPIQVGTTGAPFVYVALRDAATVDRAVSERDALAKVFEHGVFLFAAVARDRLYSRMFSPHVSNIYEDPATGSASGPLGAFAVKYGLVRRAPEVSLVSEQGTKMGRRSLVRIKLAYPPDGDLPSRIEVGGSVVPTLRGELAGGW
ncbi:MAG TPA: PhzF family phenazine biosynthesis protein [Candidatus Dormibacteraeota bacterium]|jgi:trans-2,3-dihydro-3-hydroxyanthranilate isomerase|nr:PhzF family phenazine biosynthesis protein [Candidatus Dormibacteraeota bacterium]